MIMPLDMLLMELIWIIIPFAWWKVKVSYCSYIWIIYQLIKPSSMSNIKFLNRLPGSSSTFDMLEYFRVLPPYALAEEACRWRLVGMPDGPDGGRLAKAKVHFWYQDGNLYLQNTLKQKLYQVQKTKSYQSYFLELYMWQILVWMGLLKLFLYYLVWYLAFCLFPCQLDWHLQLEYEGNHPRH